MNLESDECGEPYAQMNSKKDMVWPISLCMDPVLVYAFCCSFQKHGVDDCTVPLNIECVVLMVFTYWHWQGGAEEAVSAVEVGDMPEVEVMSTMVATGVGQTVTRACSSPREGHPWEPCSKELIWCSKEQA